MHPKRKKKIDGYMEARSDHKASFDALRGFLEVSDVLLNLIIKVLMNLSPSKHLTWFDRFDSQIVLLSSGPGPGPAMICS